MAKAQLGGVQELPGSAPLELAGPGLVAPADPAGPRTAIDRVADDRVADVGEVYANLVRPTGVELGADQVRGPPALQPVQARACRAATLDNRHPLPVRGRPCDRLVDDRIIRGQVSPRRGQVDATHLPPL